ncbi:UDP-N-acetyl-D-mannosamine dehydrogenase [Campylobacter lari]|uniref:UDP-N-acetyl-D-mannosamine dehydrogenase n=1 Tax=Campylobacter lari TaxID=201 RepID=UPI00142C4441|nr:UDP-N-acetyl-D-mannosamine dehydrogenase [Campylobacter lari]MCR2058137.1 UDP-N-acetyl-D-mannosamine dehydrogenase [Campylobacter lari subsp. concheus]EDP6837166.1 UDP-N-acetyl-D-mannosamine dehydrogenase [Campylobacter lari]EGK8006519.1 UDP-N-acetyl-D-mannosamine dehydrogenase [Campylobacter lari]EHL8053714.1 UDP-N-acetyl-D-mannosamine dehydrogenase [Campylobacter lari]MCR2074768.1 UDP-N-acetyl-D-mannosamine dehydrogenase [Campylobacter lari subsp. concheus]
MNNFNKVCIIGLGYIGLPTAAIFASRKVKVLGVDINQQVVDTINQGKIHIVEPELDILVHAVVKDGYLKAATLPDEADAFIIAVPTPFKGEDHEPNLDYIKAASKSIAKVLKKGNLVILESTSPVGATEQMAKWLADERPDLTFPHQIGEESDIKIAHCPERVLPGQVIRELVENDRIIGGMTQQCTEQATNLYKIFVQGECIKTNARTAEMTKLTENSFRDVNIAFANELSILCDKLDINVWELIKLANRHPRVNILQPGCGVGGHCIAIDPWFIVYQNPTEAKIIRTAREVNDNKPNFVIQKIKERVKGISQPKIACLGLAFKPDIDDLRESPALDIVIKLANECDNQILAVEPNIKQLPLKLQDKANIELVSLTQALDEADIVVILVKHKEFIGMQSDKLIDFVNI